MCFVRELPSFLAALHVNLDFLEAADERRLIRTDSYLLRGLCGLERQLTLQALL